MFNLTDIFERPLRDVYMMGLAQFLEVLSCTQELYSSSMLFGSCAKLGHGQPLRNLGDASVTESGDP